MVVSKGAIRVTRWAAGSRVYYKVELDGTSQPLKGAFMVPIEHLPDLVDCLAALDPRHVEIPFFAAQLGVKIEDTVTAADIDARPLPRFEGVFQRCPRNGLCVHDVLCPGSLRPGNDRT